MLFSSLIILLCLFTNLKHFGYELHLPKFSLPESFGDVFFKNIHNNLYQNEFHGKNISKESEVMPRSRLLHRGRVLLPPQRWTSEQVWTTAYPVERAERSLRSLEDIPTGNW